MDLARTSSRSVDRLLDIAGDELACDRRILVATPVHLNHPTWTCTLARMLTEHMSARLTERGYSVVDMGLRQDSIAISLEGRFLLTADPQSLPQDYNAAVVLVSTYVEGPTALHLYLRLTDAPTKRVIAAVDRKIPKTHDVQLLTRDAGRYRQTWCGE